MGGEIGSKHDQKLGLAKCSPHQTDPFHCKAGDPSKLGVSREDFGDGTRFSAGLEDSCGLQTFKRPLRNTV
ncbi:hypothetical protein FQA47_008656 [Oryzias melastigma]|uniref:Uncharacterized protein n=1 Tax=Oryzias melastigma TaxID=30732 RepID=A0A834CKD3_ORYME|nr:hypothetical protein FQA47_008656 [Oryzias melastigma]